MPYSAWLHWALFSLREGFRIKIRHEQPPAFMLRRDNIGNLVRTLRDSGPVGGIPRVARGGCSKARELQAACVVNRSLSFPQTLPHLIAAPFMPDSNMQTTAAQCTLRLL